MTGVPLTKETYICATRFKTEFDLFLLKQAKILTEAQQVKLQL